MEVEFSLHYEAVKYIQMAATREFFNEKHIPKCILGICHRPISSALKKQLQMVMTNSCESSFHSLINKMYLQELTGWLNSWRKHCNINIIYRNA